MFKITTTQSQSQTQAPLLPKSVVKKQTAATVAIDCGLVNAVIYFFEKEKYIGMHRDTSIKISSHISDWRSPSHHHIKSYHIILSSYHIIIVSKEKHKGLFIQWIAADLVHSTAKQVVVHLRLLSSEKGLGYASDSYHDVLAPPGAHHLNADRKAVAVISNRQGHRGDAGQIRELGIPGRQREREWSCEKRAPAGRFANGSSEKARFLGIWQTGLG